MDRQSAKDAEESFTTYGRNRPQSAEKMRQQEQAGLKRQGAKESAG
jgi:hypothetical protein